MYVHISPGLYVSFLEVCDTSLPYFVRAGDNRADGILRMNQRKGERGRERERERERERLCVCVFSISVSLCIISLY